MDAYEGLRRQVVQPDGRGRHTEDRGVLIRRGLATWSQTRPVARTPPESPFPSGAAAPVLDWFGTELVLLLASLILSTRKEDLLHA